MATGKAVAGTNLSSGDIENLKAQNPPKALKLKHDDRHRMTAEDLRTEIIPISQLLQHPRNPRMGDPENIASSVRAHGQYRALVVSIDNYILAGNHTYQALLGEDVTDVAVHRLPIKHDTEQAIEIMLADNRTSDFSRYDDLALSSLLIALPDPMAAAWEPGDVSRLLERMHAGGFLDDLAGSKEINAMMHAANVNTGNERLFSLPVTKAEKEEIMAMLQQVKEQWSLNTLTLALLTGLRTLVESREFRKKK